MTAEDAQIAAYARHLLENSKTLLNDNRVITVRQAFITCGYFAGLVTLTLVTMQQRCSMSFAADSVTQTTDYIADEIHFARR